MFWVTITFSLGEPKFPKKIASFICSQRHEDLINGSVQAPKLERVSKLCVNLYLYTLYPTTPKRKPRDRRNRLRPYCSFIVVVALPLSTRGPTTTEGAQSKARFIHPWRGSNRELQQLFICSPASGNKGGEVRRSGQCNKNKNRHAPLDFLLKVGFF